MQQHACLFPVPADGALGNIEHCRDFLAAEAAEVFQFHNLCQAFIDFSEPTKRLTCAA
jgi:hypothetical protein